MGIVLVQCSMQAKKHRRPHSLSCSSPAGYVLPSLPFVPSLTLFEPLVIISKKFPFANSLSTEIILDHKTASLVLILHNLYEHQHQVFSLEMAVVIQRPLRGSRISLFYSIMNLPSLSLLDSTFQLQECISLLIRLDIHSVDTIISVPGKTNKERDKNDSELKGEEKEVEEPKSEIAVDEACWMYGQL